VGIVVPQLGLWRRLYCDRVAAGDGMGF